MTRFILPLAISFTAACDRSPPPPPVDTDPVVDTVDSDPADSDTDPVDTDTEPPDTDVVVDTFHTGMIDRIFLVRAEGDTEIHAESISVRRMFWGRGELSFIDYCLGMSALGRDGLCYYSPQYTNQYSFDPKFTESRLIASGFCSQTEIPPPVALEDDYLTCCESVTWNGASCGGGRFSCCPMRR
jgi:hypothetical protein